MTIMAQRLDLKDNWTFTRHKRNNGKETIHSGHFMISNFEAEAQDDEDELAVPVPEVAGPKAVLPCRKTLTNFKPAVSSSKIDFNQVSIETSLTSLFQCMSIAYRQKLTSPKWNRFKGIRLRWKDKIRLNNVIWRCWHMQFINKQSTLVCQFASPLDVDTHNKPEAIVLEGKYWKRKLRAVTAEYKKWRMFTHNQILGRPEKYGQDLLAEFEISDCQTQASDSAMMVDEDYMNLMSDTLFSAITGNVPFHFPDSREIARGTNIADFIQPSLVQLQPSLDDEFMDIEPLNELLCTKLTSVAEDIQNVSSSYTKEAVRAEIAYSGDSSYPVWYIPPSNYGQQSLYPAAPPPPPPPLSIGPPLNNSNSSSKVKPKHRTRSSVAASKKHTSTSPGQSPHPPAVSPPIQPQIASSLSSQPQNSALLEQLLTTSSSNLYNFLETPSESSVVTKMTPISQANQLSLQTSQCIDVPYLPSPYEQSDSSQSYYRNRKTSEIIGSPEHVFGVSPENSLLPSTPPGNSSPSKVTLLSPVTPPLPSKGGPVNSCPESPAGSSQEQLTLSPLNVGSPSSPKSLPGYKEHRRVCHINAEQKRRCNIKNGFDTLHSLIPQLNQNPNAKMSKAAMLQKGADYIVQLRNERSTLKQEMESLKQQIESLNNTICNCQSMLPVTGAPISRHRSNRMRDMFRQYVRARTNESWKFWILSLIFEPLLDSFNNNVSTNSLEDLYQTTLQWVDQHCTLVDLRPVVLNALRQLCTTTEVLTDPGRLPSEARAAVEKTSKKSSGH